MYPIIGDRHDESVQKVNAGLARLEQKKPQITIQLETTQMNVQTALKNAQGLRQRLAPLMTESLDESRPKDTQEAGTQLGRFIEEVNSGLAELNEVLLIIHRNLQI